MIKLIQHIIYIIFWLFSFIFYISGLTINLIRFEISPIYNHIYWLNTLNYLYFALILFFNVFLVSSINIRSTIKRIIIVIILILFGIFPLFYLFYRNVKIIVLTISENFWNITEIFWYWIIFLVYFKDWRF